jgi:disulfide bond formation protein DsbB
MNTPNPQMDEFPFLPALILLGAFCLVIAFLLAMQPQPPAAEVAAAPTEIATEEPPTPTTEPTVEPTAVAAAEAVAYDPALVSQGQTLYASTCVACHGPNARGIPGLGKDLLASEFVHGLSDEELTQFVIVGRRPWDEGNTTGIDMPGRGGNPGLTDEDIHAIVAFLRTETVNAGITPSTGGAVAEAGAAGEATAEATTVTAVVQNPTTAATVTPLPILAPGEGAVATLPPADPRDGQTTYNFLCAGCHGANGEGTANNGPAITDSELLADDAAMVEFLTNPVQIAPGTDFVHPARGGYPPLTDEEIQPLIDYMHSLAGAE